MKMKKWLLVRDVDSNFKGAVTKTEPTKTINGHTSWGNVKCTQDWRVYGNQMHSVSATAKLNDDDDDDGNGDDGDAVTRSSFAFIFRAHILMWWHFVEWVETELWFAVRIFIVRSEAFHCSSTNIIDGFVSARTVRTTIYTECTSSSNLRLCIKICYKYFVCKCAIYLLLVVRCLSACLSVCRNGFALL